MKRLIIILSIFIFTGCSMHLPFNDRLSYQSLKQIQSDINLKNKPILHIVWQPKGFPERIDIQGASGFVGGGTRTRIPTGVGLSSRIEEAISTYADINVAGRPLIITVDYAKTKFTYSFSNIDYGEVSLNLTFNLDGKIWSKNFFAKNNDDSIRDASQTAVVESVWDQVALDVAKEVANNL